jgi:WD40 repeat protein
MLFFSNPEKLDAQVAREWCGDWVGISVWTERATSANAGKELVKAIERAAKNLDVPVMIAMTETRSVGVDIKSGQTKLWSSSVSIATVWDAHSGAELFQLPGHSADVRHVRYSPDGTHLATSARDGTVLLRDPSNGQTKLTVNSGAGGISFVPGSGLIVLGNDNYGETSLVWDLSAGTEVCRQNQQAGVDCLAVCQDGLHVITGHKDETACLWDVTTGRMLSHLSKHGATLSAVAISPNAQFLLTATWGRRITIFLNRQGRELLRLPRKKSLSLAISTDGKRLITGDTEGTATVWNSEQLTR